jgi:predicted SAM-dependent methyltransferase
MNKEKECVKLNLGCGPKAVSGWVNVDCALGARLAKVPFFRTINKKMRFFDNDWSDKIYIRNLTKRFPWPDSSVDVIYSSHTLEHFSKEEGQKFLHECHRVLRKRGLIRLVVPDLRPFVEEYIEGKIESDDFIEKLGVLYSKRPDNDIFLKKALYASVQYPHKCAYDTHRLLTILTSIGFTAASRGAFDSDISDICLIESEGRTKNAVILEGYKR